MASECQRCGAAYRVGLILCRFCRTPFDEEEARRATPCPRCQELYASTTQRCAPCEQWLVVRCLFCEGLSPYTRTTCDSCGEAFAGAEARQAARGAQPAAWPTGAPASGWSGSGSSDGWSSWGAPAAPDTADLFAGFGRGGAPPAPAPASDEGRSPWQLDDWVDPKRSR